MPAIRLDSLPSGRYDRRARIHRPGALADQHMREIQTHSSATDFPRWASGDAVGFDTLQLRRDLHFGREDEAGAASGNVRRPALCPGRGMPVRVGKRRVEGVVGVRRKVSLTRADSFAEDIQADLQLGGFYSGLRIRRRNCGEARTRRGIRSFCSGEGRAKRSVAYDAIAKMPCMNRSGIEPYNRGRGRIHAQKYSSRASVPHCFARNTIAKCTSGTRMVGQCTSRPGLRRDGRTKRPRAKMIPMPTTHVNWAVWNRVEGRRWEGGQIEGDDEGFRPRLLALSCCDHCRRGSCRRLDRVGVLGLDRFVRPGHSLGWKNR